MKNTLIIFSILAASLTSFAEGDEPQNPGDNLDLAAVLNLFEKSASVEDFEKALNSDKNEVNNLDLNDDGFVDYIRVIDYADGNTHSLTLQVPYSDAEAQDVAVILIEEDGDETSIQIVGDEDVYGENQIIEPGEEGSDAVVNVHHWKPIRHIYSPKYVVWASPWRFGVYPNWYRPWKPVTWSVYRGRFHHHPIACRRASVYRSNRAHAHYHKHRVHSHTYHHKHKNVHTKQQVKANTKKKQQGTMKSSRSTGKPTKRPGGTHPSGNRRN